MDVACPACLSGPSGFDGHSDLLVHTLGTTVLSFSCRRCTSLWTRSAKRPGVFVWTLIDERTSRSPTMGVVLPPRPRTYVT